MRKKKNVAEPVCQGVAWPTAKASVNGFCCSACKCEVKATLEIRLWVYSGHVRKIP